MTSHEAERVTVQLPAQSSLRTKAVVLEMQRDSLPDVLIRNHDTSLYGSHDDPSCSLNNRASSKVTFESLMTQSSLPASPKTKDQSVMAQIDFKGRFNPTNVLQETVHDITETRNGRSAIVSEGTITSGSTSAKSSVKELVGNPKPITHRKSKSQNRARKALRTITFILGEHTPSDSIRERLLCASRRFRRLLDAVVSLCFLSFSVTARCSRHIYSAIHSLCESCKNNWIFSNPMFHCFYFLCYLNSPINPFCYALANQQFKKTFTRILRLDLRRL